MRISGERPNWIDLFCPFHPDGHASASIAVDELGDKPRGIFICRGCGETMDFVSFWSRIQGISKRDAKAQIRERFHGSGQDSGTGRMPTEEQVAAWSKILEDDEEAQAYLSKRCISTDVAKLANLGMDRGRIKLPVRTANNDIVNVRTHAWRASDREAGAPKMSGMSGASTKMIYPANLIDKKSPIVWVEGEIDCLSLRSIGVNAATTIGGAQSYMSGHEFFEPWIPSGPDSEVYLCLDNDKMGRAALVAFKRWLFDYGVHTVWVIRLPTDIKDINDLLQATIERNRLDVWNRLVISASKQSKQDQLSERLHIHEGAIVNADFVEIAPFTGEVIESGRMRYGQSSIDTDNIRYYVLSLTHKDGSHITVDYQDGGLRTFCQAVMDTGGPSWAFPQGFSDEIFKALCRSSVAAEPVDSGWIFGWEGTDRQRFWTKLWVFTSKGALQNTEIRMIAPSEYLGRLNIPSGDESIHREATRILLTDVYSSHGVAPMALLISSAVLAPVRRLAWPNEDRYSVLIYGPTGSGKTSRALFCAAMFGLFTTSQTIETWRSTPKYIEQLQGYAGDCWLLIDELPVGKGDRRTIEDALRVLQGVAQGSGRSRLTRAADLRSGSEPACILASTMEALPDGDESLIARSIPIFVPQLPGKGLLDPAWDLPYQRARKEMMKLQFVTSGWVQWCLGGDGSARVFDESRDEADTVVRTVLDSVYPIWYTVSNSTRIFIRSVTLTATWFAFLTYAVRTNAIGQEQYVRLRLDWIKTALPNFLMQFLGNICDLGLGTSFILSIQSALRSGEYALQGRSSTGKCVSTLYPKCFTRERPVIGYLVDCDGEKGDSDGVLFEGRRVTICLTSTVTTTISRYLDTKVSWATVKSYLAQWVETEHRKRFRDHRVLWCNEKGTTLLLEALGSPIS